MSLETPEVHSVQWVDKTNLNYDFALSTIFWFYILEARYEPKVVKLVCVYHLASILHVVSEIPLEYMGTKYDQFPVWVLSHKGSRKTPILT